MKIGKNLNKRTSTKIFLNSEGLSLLEVLIALTIFAVFATAYLTSESFNLSDSILFKKELFLKQLCERKLNQILLEPPELNDSLTLSSEKGTFRETGLENYEYEIQYKRFLLPNFDQLQGEQSEEEAEEKDGATAALEKKVYEMMKKNMEDLVWQVQVTVKEKGTNFPFSLSTWLTNQKAKVKITL